MVVPQISVLKQTFLLNSINIDHRRVFYDFFGVIVVQTLKCNTQLYLQTRVQFALRNLNWMIMLPYLILYLLRVS